MCRKEVARVHDAVDEAAPESVFIGNSELAMRMRSLDWSQTSLGAVETWPDNLKIAVQTVLTELEQAAHPAKTPLESQQPLEYQPTEVWRQAAQADAFRDKLINTLRPLKEADEIQATAARLLGESLGASRVIYIEVLPSGKEVFVHKNYTNGVAALNGRYNLEDFGRSLAEDHQAGQTAIVPNVANHPKYAAAEKARYRAIDIAAHVDVPLIKNDRFVALLAVHQATPRMWTQNEVKQVEETAEQTWAAVERARAEAALCKSEAKYRTLFESIAQSFCLCEMLFDEQDNPIDFRILEVNPVFEAMTGLHNPVGKTARELVPDLEAHWFEVYGSVVQSGNPIRFENQSIAMNRWFDVNALRVNEPGSHQFALLFTDVTNRKRAEEALRSSEERFRNLAENASIMVWVTDTTGHCTYLSRSWSAFSGQPEADGLGFGWLDVVHPDDRDATKATFLFANEHQEAFQLEYRLRRKDGIYRTCIDVARPWFGSTNEFKGYIGSVIDIDDRKQAEAALRQSEERYRTLFESIDEGFCIVELLFDAKDTPIDYRFLEINPAFEQQTGLQQAVGRTARELKLEEHWIKIYGQVALTGEAVRFEHASVTLKRWFNGYACRTGEPEARKVAIVFEDISDRKRTDEILRQTSAFNAFRIALADALRPLATPTEIQATASRVLGEYLGANRVAYFEVRGADYVVERDYANGAMPLAGHYPIDSFGSKLLAAYRTGQTVCTPNVEADQHLTSEQRAAYAAIQIGAYIGIPLLKGGKFVAGLAIHSANPRMWTAEEIALAEEVAERTWADVERARVEVALRDSENRFRMAIESAQLGTWDWNLVTNQLIWDERCKAMFGLPPDAESSIEVFYAGLHPDDRERLEQLVQQVLRPNSNGQYNTEYRTIGMQDGIERWIAARGQVYFDAANKPQRFVGTVLNITEQKYIEAQREQLLASEQAAREAADRANRIKDEFLAVLSHELRSPLNPILGWSKLLQQGKVDAAKATTALATIERNAQLQVQLIDDLLDISRILRGKLSLTVTPVDLSTVITAALETVCLAAEAKAIHIQTTVSAQVAIVLGDAGRLQQVVWNLLSNAVKFTPAGGRVTVALSAIDSMAQIQISDTGKGIRPSFLPYVFEHFRQEDGATTRKFGGLGLGLAIVRQIVELHGGTVTVDSPGEAQGATFTVRIPLAPHSQMQPPTNRFPNLERDLSGIHVLVADDDADSREFVGFVLEKAGAIVTTVASGAEALQAVSQAVPDILISDIGMPEIDGYMLLRRLRSLPPEQGGHIPAVALTAYAGEANQQKAIGVGYQYHLAKPIDPIAVVAAVAEFVSPA